MSFFSDPEHDLDAADVADLLERGEIELIDVREPYEWEAGRIDGARHIEMERLAFRQREIPRDRRVVFQCRLGARSSLVTRAFRDAGWDAWNLRGGIVAWQADGLPIQGEIAPH